MTAAAGKPTWRERIAFLGERRVNVLELNLALDRLDTPG